MANGQDLRGVSDRIESLSERLATSGDASTRAAAEDLVRLVMEFYGAGLERILEVVHDSGPDGEVLIDRLGDDQLVSGLLVLHGIHPLALETRIAKAIDTVSPYMDSHGGGVTVAGIEGDVVRLQLQGSCEGCPSSAVTLRYALEKAILEAAPEIRAVEAVEITAEAPPKLIQLDRRASDGHLVGDGHVHGNGDGHGNDHGHGAPRRTVPAAASEWVAADGLPALLAGGVAGIELQGTHVLVCGGDNELWAYRDACPNCRSPLVDGRLDARILTCKVCGHAFDVGLAGRQVGGTLHLDPFPLLSEAGAVRIAIPVGMA
ncbi:MAG: NifU family protein [Candidatus Limnocylindrales bacterium]